MSSMIVALARRPMLAAGLALALTALAIPGLLRLEVRADLETLLPEGSPAAEGYRLFLRHFAGLEQVFVLILPGPASPEAASDAAVADEADLANAAALLEEILTASPEVASVRAGIGEGDERFFLRYVAPRAPLLIAGDWRGAVAERLEPPAIRERVARLKAQLSGPDGLARGALARVDPLGFSDQLASAASPADLPIDPLTSTFLAPSGDAALVVLTPVRSELDPEGGRALAAELEAAYAAVREKLDVPLTFRALGGPLYAAQDERLLRQDLRRTLTGSLAGTSALLIAAFGGLALPLTALAPLAAGLLWTAGWMGLGHPQVTAVAIGFGAVLVGLGLDYGIHAAARFRQACLADADAERALAATARHTGPGIATSALTTAAAFTVLAFAHFRPLAELGWLVALGILSILVALVLIGAPLAAAVARRLRLADGARDDGARDRGLWRLLGGIVEVLVAFAERRPRRVLAVAALLSGLALWHLPRLAIDPDPRALRPYDHPARQTETLLVERFDLGLDTANVVVAGDDLAQALARAAAAGDELRQALGDGARISSPADHLTLGEPAAERLRRLAEMPLERAAGDLERELAAANLNPRAFRVGLDALRAMARGEDPGAPPAEAWPDWLSRSLAGGDGGAWASISLRLPPDSWPDGPPPALIQRVRQVAPGSAVASATALGPELRALAATDLRTLSLLALAAVAAVVLASFRGRVVESALAGLPVALGTLWTLGLWAGLGRSLDLFTLAVMPIMLGIGIDDGLHVVHGARRRPSEGLGGAARGAGRALVLTTLTTAVGFGSLLLSHIPGLQSGGLLIAAGVLVCLLATVMVLPAIEASRRSRA